MNKEEILAMEAGKELDILVAEKVMNWEIRYSSTDTEKKYLPAMITNDGGKAFAKFSTDISAAWEVVEKLRGTHCYQFYDYGRNMHKGDPHQATFVPSDKGHEYASEVRASTLPLAICKAALLTTVDS